MNRRTVTPTGTRPRLATATSRIKTMTKDERAMLNELFQDESDRLSEWEMEFLDSLDALQTDLTGRQSDKLAEIWKKVFP